MKFLVTGGWCRTSLALIHSLPSDSVIIVGSHYKFSMSFYTKRTIKSVIYDDPELNPNSYISDIRKIVAKYKVDVIIPSLEEGFVIAKYVDFFAGVSIRFPTFEKIDLLSDKFKFYEFCVTNNFPVANGRYIKASELTVPCTIELLKSRCVLKRQFSNGGKGVYDSKFLDNKFASKFSVSEKILVQNFVEGYGLTVEGIWDGYNCDCLTVRKTYRFKKPIGGAAVIIQNSVHVKAVDISRSIMGKLDFRGPAQVEFIIDANDLPILIEINPRWWGTTPFNYNIGRNFSNYLVNDVIQNSVHEYSECNVGVWYLGFFASLFTYNFKSTIKLIFTRSLFPRGKVVPIDIVENDLFPFLVQFLSYPFNVLISTLKGAKRVVLKDN